MNTTPPATGAAFGVDIGGSGIKAAPVDLAAGALARPRHKFRTPRPATPDAIVDVIAQLFDHFEVPESMPIGVAYPGVIFSGVIGTAANLSKKLIGRDLVDMVRQATGRTVLVANDADAAGYAELVYGAAKGVEGTVLVMTLGTGIGSALFVDGRLVPNTELGHLVIDGLDAEVKAASSARDREKLSWKEWAANLQRYFSVVDGLIHPDLFVVGGGVSRDHEKFLPRLALRPPIIPATLRNTAGIVGVAALAARAAEGEAAGA
ncbi:MAG: ROK family protein [Bifidobacteriaceae bacterium]|jgi:polyphosphate glucokinase|nr:ROK family protein [Bifidobacteriaceae bacterium]